MLWSTQILWRSFSRRVRTLNVNACAQGIVPGGSSFKRTFYPSTCKSNSKMLHSFEECVFRTTIGVKKCISSSMVNYSDNSKVATTQTAAVDTITTKIKTSNIPSNINETLSPALSKGQSVESNGHGNNSIDYREQEQEQQHECEVYEEAVKALNSLQSNAESLRSSLHQRKRLNSLQDTEKYLIRSGLTIKDLESLSFIHVAGTKGKGSTCALTESILRHYGVKTGFYSSPHLVSLTERIRLNGQPISKQKFTHYFWPVYNSLKAQQEFDNDMPAYFKFLTILCFHIYLAEKVDAVILEVGIGGELDCTNVVPHTKTVGITSLGLEHTQLLGNTLPEIAWQKAGIIKQKSMVYTSVNQSECLEVISRRAQEKEATLHIVPDFQTYFGADEKHQKLRDSLNNVTLLNGSLAIQLAYDWLRQNRNGFCQHYDINKSFLTEQAAMGLLNCNWPGRCQMVKFFNFNMHLDGAHTVESMQVCGDWFAKVTRLNTQPKILIFNTTGDRDSRKLLTILRNFAQFDLVCFVPNIATMSTTPNPDTQSLLYSQVEQLKRAQMHSKNWQDLCRESGEANRAKTYPSVLSCFQHIRQVYADKSQELDILVTGSIHLLGATILSLNELCNDLRED